MCNVYMHRLNRAWHTTAFGVPVRFADDAVVMCRSPQQAQAALARLRQVLAELGLEPAFSCSMVTCLDTLALLTI
jgi:RNA-directed DNA polymerase